MSDWQSYKLRELIGNPISGSRPSGGVSTEGEGIPSLGGENVITSGGITFQNLNLVSEEFYSLMPKGKLQPYDVLINKDGAQTGKVGLYKVSFQKACVNEHLFILRHRNPDNDQSYLYYSVLSPETQIKISRCITGSAQPGLNTTFVDAVEILLPNDPLEQKKIAKILSTIDAEIEQTEALIAKWQKIKAGMMQDLFTRGVTPDGRLRPPYAEAPHLYKESPLGWIPKEWGISKIGVEFSVQLGKMLDEKKNMGELKPYIGNIAVQWGKIDVSDLAYMRMTIADKEKYRLEDGDLLVCEGGEVGRSAIWSTPVEECYYQKALHRLRPQGVLSAEFMEAYLFYAATINLFINYTSQTSIAHLTQEKINLVPVVVPDKKEQERMVNILSKAKKVCMTEQKKLRKFKSIKSGLMHDLLTGNVRVAVPDDEKDAA